VDGSGLNQSIQPLSYLYSTTDLFLQGAILGRAATPLITSSFMQLVAGPSRDPQ